MSTLKKLKEEIDEGLKHQVIGGAALVAAIMGSLGHSSKEADYHKHMKKTYGSENPTSLQILKYHNKKLLNK